jgi:DNA-directed RNA polymerase subunit alpha
MENFLLPSKVEFIPGENELRGSLVVSPCFHGYGTTLGNALRRVLLSSLPGGAVEAFKIRGSQHEFGAVEGVQEDVVEVILNLKQLAIKVFTDEQVTLSINKKGPGVVTAADISKDANVEVINKDLVICNLTSNKPFEMEIMVGRGRGFKPVEEKDKKNYSLGTIAIDSVYNPVKDVGYKVDYMRVGDITNYEKLIVNIETNGTIAPEDAIKQSVQILMDYMSVIIAGNAVEQVQQEAQEEIEEKTEPIEEPEEEPEKKTKRKTKKK